MMEVPVAEGDRVFISDVHLGGFEEAENREIEERLLTFLDFVNAKGLRLFVLGDLFDYWMEYRGRWPEYGERVLEAFEKVNRRHPVLYITGNHDNWTGPRLERAGFDLEHEYRYLDLDGNQVLLMHGDGLKDARFNFPRARFHRLLRNPYFLAVYQTVFPPGPGIELMRQFSHKSKLRDEFRKKVISQRKLDIKAEKMLENGLADVVICGHHHHPVFRRVTGGLYINLGNFYQDSSMAVYTRNGFSLVTWQADNACFQLLKS